MQTEPVNQKVPARYTTSGTFTHLNVNTEQTVLTVAANNFGGFGLVTVEVDCSAMTKNGITARMKSSTDPTGGGTFTIITGAPITGSVTFNAAAAVNLCLATANSFRFTLQSGTLEGATRSIPWKVTVY